MYVQGGSTALQTFLRSQYIHFRKSEEEEKKEIENEKEKRQTMLLSHCYLAIAGKLGLEHANLCALDKCIEHDKKLSVS
jgi:hypothetical protein